MAGIKNTCTIRDIYHELSSQKISRSRSAGRLACRWVDARGCRLLKIIEQITAPLDNTARLCSLAIEEMEK